MSKKIIISMSGIIGLIIIVVGFFLVNTFLIGKTMPVDRIYIKSISVQNSQINIQGDFLIDSALAYKGFKYRMDDNNLYIKINSVLVSSIHKYSKFDFTVDGDFNNIQKVYLEDSAKTKPIWNKE